jgi:shikimate dehydrogenase
VLLAVINGNHKKGDMKVYGLLGKTLSHSFSQRYFSEKFQNEHITNCVYQNFELKDLEKEIPRLKNEPALSGLNVTIPYKTDIIPFLDNLTDDCRQMNACNCIKIIGEKWTGYNTDVIGFKRSFAPHLKSFHKKALILGTGGASKAVRFVLGKMGIQFLEVTRNKKDHPSAINYDDITKEIFNEYNIIVNTTPLGMYPNLDAYPNLPYQFVTNQHYFFDLIYNPAKTLFLSKAEANGASIENGEKMLVIQADESWAIWNS